MPAIIEKMREVTLADKVNILGHSQGTAMMWYALSKKQDYFAERVNRFIANAACIFADLENEGGETYEKLSNVYWQLEKRGIYNLYGNDAASAGKTGLDCIARDDPDCDYYEGEGILPDWPQLARNAVSTAAFLYFGQLTLERRFQEPQDMLKYFTGERHTALVPLSNIDRVAVSIVHSPGDERCAMPFAEWIYTEITTPDKHLVVHKGDHKTIQFWGDESFASMIDQVIKTGNIVDSSTIL